MLHESLAACSDWSTAQTQPVPSLFLSPSLPLSFSLSLPRPPSLLCSLLQAITHTCTQIGTDIYAPRCQAHRVFDASADNASVFGDHERSKIVALSINCRRLAASSTSFHNRSSQCMRAWRLDRPQWLQHADVRYSQHSCASLDYEWTQTCDAR